MLSELNWRRWGFGPDFSPPALLNRSNNRGPRRKSDELCGRHVGLRWTQVQHTTIGGNGFLFQGCSSGAEGAHRNLQGIDCLAGRNLLTHHHEKEKINKEKIRGRPPRPAPTALPSQLAPFSNDRGKDWKSSQSRSSCRHQVDLGQDPSDVAVRVPSEIPLPAECCSFPSHPSHRHHPPNNKD